SSMIFNGHDCLRLSAGAVDVVVSTSVGPRVLGLITEDGSNAFAELPDMTLPCPGSTPIHLYGGHRHWAAPEDPRLTYRPDDDPVAVEELADGVRLSTEADAVSGTSRDTIIRVTGPQRLAVEHRVINRSQRPQRLAAWAITMLRPGGRAWLPLLTEPFDEGGFQGQRNIVLWSYARQDDPRLVIGDGAIEVRAREAAGLSADDRFKVGTSLRRGWAAHWNDGVLFVKRAGHDESREYVDMGASGQIFSHVDFTELETLGPLTDLAPGEAVTHTERWEVHLVGEGEAERLVMSGELDER
ncbi:MAG: hypothetical protein ACC726_14065, partial [Chloroflexota bacterium]